MYCGCHGSPLALRRPGAACGVPRASHRGAGSGSDAPGAAARQGWDLAAERAAGPTHAGQSRANREPPSRRNQEPFSAFSCSLEDCKGNRLLPPVLYWETCFWPEENVVTWLLCGESMEMGREGWAFESVLYVYVRLGWAAWKREVRGQICRQVQFPELDRLLFFFFSRKVFFFP